MDEIDFSSGLDDGRSRKLPGPLDPPWSSRPSRNITALSYSCTTLKQTQREKGIVTRTRAHEIIVRSSPQSPTPLSDSSAVTRNRTQLLSLVSCCALPWYTIHRRWKWKQKQCHKNLSFFPRFWWRAFDESTAKETDRMRHTDSIRPSTLSFSLLLFPLLSVLLLSLLLMRLGKKEPVG